MKIRQIQNAEIDGADFYLRARLPNEIAAVNFGVKGSNEDADTPQRQSCDDHPFAASAINRLGLVADLPPSISQSASSCTRDASMTAVFAAQLQETSSALPRQPA